MPDVLASLLPLKWRDAEVPCTRLRMSLAHDLVPHAYYGVDGARVEATGVAPLRFSATIPLHNGVGRGPNEHWDLQLYPGVMRKLIVAFARRTTGVLQHPEFGPILCKAERLDMDWEAGKRSGIEAEATWVQDDDVATSVALSEPSPAANAQVAAAALDQNKRDLKALVPQLPDDGDSFEEAMTKLTAVPDQFTIAQMRAAGQVDRVLYRVRRLASAAARAKTALSWPIEHNRQALEAAAFDLRERLRAIDRDIVLYRVPARTTLAGVGRQLPDSKIVDLIQLNPELMRHPVVPAGAVVRYYVPRIAA